MDRMQIRIANEGMPMDAWDRNFVHTTLGFATARHEPAVQAVRARLSSESGPDGEERIRCALHASSDRRLWVGASAIGEDLYEAVTEAANELELALFRSIFDDDLDRDRIHDAA